MKNYRKRITDSSLEQKLEAFGATLIVGPKGCGKTTTAKQYAKSYIEFQDEDNRERYLSVAEHMPSKLLIGDKPRLFDEWQDAPKIWGAIRKDVDDTGEKGQYILTGSSSQKVETAHTGTLRISTLKMYPMSLFESGESSGEISLMEVFNGKRPEWVESGLSIDDLIYAVCRGGWPGSIDMKNRDAALSIVPDLFYQTCHTDISNINHIRRNPLWAERILRSYSRNLCTLAETKTHLADVTAAADMSRPTFYNYFQSKESVLMCLLARLVQQVADALRENRAAGKSQIELLDIACQVTAAFLDENRFVLPLFLSASTMAEIKDRGESIPTPGFKPVYTKIIEEGQRVGEIRTDVPAALIAEMFHSIFQAAAFSKLQLSFQENVALKTRLLLDGIRTR